MPQEAKIERALFPTEQKWSVDDTFPSVGIIMRTKDRPILLSRALASVLSQSQQDWMLYLVNDGGDDTDFNNTVKTYQNALGPRIKITHNKISLGMEAASNRALCQTNEKYVVVHDDDDAWHPDFLKNTVAYLENNPHYAAVATNCVVIHEIIDNDRPVELFREKWSQWRPFVDACDLLSRNIAPPISILIRSSVISLIGNFNENLPVLGDWDYNIRLFMAGDIGTIDQELAYYYQRASENSVYGNSVRIGVDKHNLYQTLYRNALVRDALEKDRNLLGVVHVLFEKIERSKKEILLAVEQSVSKRDAEISAMRKSLENIEKLLSLPHKG